MKSRVVNLTIDKIRVKLFLLYLTESHAVPRVRIIPKTWLSWFIIIIIDTIFHVYVRSCVDGEGGHFVCTSTVPVCVQALASLRQKIKKYIKEADFETSVEEFRKVGTYVRDTWREHSCGRGDRGLSALAACCSVCTMHHTLYI